MMVGDNTIDMKELLSESNIGFSTPKPAMYAERPLPGGQVISGFTGPNANGSIEALSAGPRTNVEDYLAQQQASGTVGRELGDKEMNYTVAGPRTNVEDYLAQQQASGYPVLQERPSFFGAVDEIRATVAAAGGYAPAEANGNDISLQMTANAEHIAQALEAAKNPEEGRG